MTKVSSNSRITLMFLATLLGVIPAAALAEAPTAAAPAPAPSASERILNEVHQTNQMEIHMGRLAADKGATRAVRSYGRKLIRDHEKADARVRRIAGKARISLSEGGPHDKVMAQLGNLQGEAFDREFLKEMARSHRQAIQDVELASQTLKGTPTGKLMKKLLPTLKKHEAIALKLEKRALAR